MEGQPFCGFDSQLAEGFTAAPWPQRRLNFFIDTGGYRGNLAVSAIKDVITTAFMSWASIIDIEPVSIGTASQAQIVMRFGPIDGPNGTLAWSHLSDGTMSQKQQLYDAGEAWETRFSLLAVAAHEIGHVLGLDHDAKNANALMRPTYDPNIRAPQSRDVQRMLALGYKPAPIVPPIPDNPPPATPTGKPVVITLWGATKVDIDPGDLPVRPMNETDSIALALGGE